jgi:aspartate racemase
MKGVLGILGGMGPLASTEFVSTIYRLHPAAREQEAPPCLLLSDPRFPDRTEEILRGDTRFLAQALTEALSRLVAAGADRLVVACVTVHVVLDALPRDLAERVISLLDVILATCLQVPRRRLLLASSGTRTARLFESHPGWEAIAPMICVPTATEQEELHAWIYRLKRGEAPRDCCAWVEDLRLRHHADESIFACTELHLLHRAAADAAQGPLPALDPLWIVARDLGRTGAGSRA